MKLTNRQADALGHIAEHCGKAISLARRIGSEDQLRSDWEAQYALVRCIEIIGEASGRLGQEYHLANPQVPWRLLANMRNRLIHGYDDVRVDLLWQTAQEDAPKLREQIEAILAEASL